MQNNNDAVQANDAEFMGSQSSLDDAIANMCTGDLAAAASSTEKAIQEKENKDLQGYLDDGDEDFLELNY